MGKHKKRLNLKVRSQVIKTLALNILRGHWHANSSIQKVTTKRREGFVFMWKENLLSPRSWLRA